MIRQPTKIDDPTAPKAPGDIVTATLCWIAGITAGHFCVRAEPWLAAGGIATMSAIAMAVLRRGRGVRAWAFVALIALGGAWVIQTTIYTNVDDIRQYITGRSELVQVTGVVAGWPRISQPPDNSLAQASHYAPGSIWLLDTRTINVDGQPRPVTGCLRMRMHQPDRRMHDGDQVRATGWLGEPEPPANPGEPDLRTLLTEQGIAGYLTLRERGDWELIAPAGPLARLWWAPAWLSDAASDSLHLGMKPDAARLDLLDALLLGRRPDQPDASGESFRRVGLAYLLAISGAHLSVLLGLVWMAARLASPYPGRAAATVLVALGCYLLMVPAHVPILRSAVMAAMLCLAYGVGRKADSTKVLALSAFLLLIWRPNDLFDAGFQLSFVVVTAALLFVQPTARWIWTRPMSASGPDRAGELTARWVADYLAFNCVATFFALPLVAYHFGVINPLGLGLSILSFPIVALVMGVGFIKILVGWVFPSLGLLMARPLEWVTALITQPIGNVAAWRTAQITLLQAPSALWTLATLGVITAMFMGWFFRRRAALFLALGLCAAWLAWPDLGAGAVGQTLIAKRVATIRLTSFSVGDGSCYLLRLADANNRYTLMFNCGSRESSGIGKYSVVPALRSLGVNRIDTLIISHADVNQFSGVLDLMDQVPVGRVLTTYYVLDTAHERSHGATGLLIQGIRNRNLSIETILRGWHERQAGADLDMLWPPPDLNEPHPDDTSLVLSVRAAGRRLLLNGDIQQAAITGLLEGGTDLKADITDLPLHGGFVPASPRWLAAVSPSMVLQSTGPRRLDPDKWAGEIDPKKITRLITQREGMINVEISPSGAMTWSDFNEHPQ